MLRFVLAHLVRAGALDFMMSFDEVTVKVFMATLATKTLPVRMFLYFQEAQMSPDRCVGLETSFIGHDKGNGRW